MAAAAPPWLPTGAPAGAGLGPSAEFATGTRPETPPTPWNVFGAAPTTPSVLGGGFMMQASASAPSLGSARRTSSSAQSALALPHGPGGDAVARSRPPSTRVNARWRHCMLPASYVYPEFEED